jgi:hypothetical protein
VGIAVELQLSRNGGYNIIPWRGEEDYRWKILRDSSALKGRMRFGLYLFGVAASGNLINFTLPGPVLLVLLFLGSSIMTEKISSSKYPEYSTYQKEVPKFIPRIFGKK